MSGEWKRIMLQFDSLTSLFLRGDGTDGSVTIDDSSESRHNVSGHGDANMPEIDRAQYKFGGSSILFDASDNQYLSISDHTDFDLSGKEFTITFWLNISSLPLTGLFEYRTLFSQGTDANNYMRIHIYKSYLPLIGRRTYLQFWVSEGGISRSMSARLNEDTWYEVKIVGDDNINSIYIDGTLSISSPSEINVLDYIGDLTIGGSPNLNSPYLHFNGWIDDFRIVKGLALHPQ